MVTIYEYVSLEVSGFAGEKNSGIHSESPVDLLPITNCLKFNF
jgi:hypothetical protein